MHRVSLRGGTWFDPDKAIRLEEGTWWNGSNHISRATGSEWDHECLYYTRRGSWVCHRWSQRDAEKASYDAIPEEDALEWIVTNELTDGYLKRLPEAVRLRLLEDMKGQEV